MRQGVLPLIQRFGIDGFSFRELARDLGVSHGAPYRHFSNKEELLANVALDGYRALYTCMHEASQQTAEPLEQIRLAGKAYITFAQDNRELYTLMFDHYFDPATWPELHTTIFLAAGVIEAAVKQCRRQGMMKGHEVKDHVNYAWAVTHGIAKLLNTGRLPVADCRARNAFIDFALESALGTWPK